jgi:hypothetical protein
MFIQHHGALQQSKIGTSSSYVSLSPTSLKFEDSGSPYTYNYTYVTSSGSWTASLPSGDPYSILQNYTASGSGSGNAYVDINYNDSYENCQYVVIRYTSGTAYADLVVYRDGITNTYP